MSGESREIKIMKPKTIRNLIGIVSLFAFFLALAKAAAQSYDCDDPPIILCHPECRLVQAGTSNVTFSVVVENPLEIPNFELTYQWQKNTALGKSEYENISGATNETYTIQHQVEDLDVAFYRVLATGSGTATSAPAALQIWTTNSPLTVSGPIAFFCSTKDQRELSRAVFGRCLFWMQVHGCLGIRAQLYKLRCDRHRSIGYEG